MAGLTVVPDGTYDCTGQSGGKGYALSYLQGFSGLHLTRFRVSPDHCRVGITVDSTRSDNTLHFINALWGIISGSNLSQATISTGYTSRTLVVDLATMPDLPTRVHLDSLCSIAGCVESYSRTHTVPGAVAGSSSASGWGGNNAGSMPQDWSQPPPGLSQTMGACWDCAQGLCLRPDHGGTGLAPVKVSNTPAHSAATGSQGPAPVYQDVGVSLDTSTASQGSLPDLSSRSRLPSFTDVPPVHALYVPSRYPSEAQFSDVTPDTSVTSQASRPPSPMDTQTTSEAVLSSGPEAAPDTKVSVAPQGCSDGTDGGLSALNSAPAASGPQWGQMTAGTTSVTDTFSTLTPIPAPVPFSRIQGPSGSTPSVSEGILPPISQFLQSLPELNLDDTKVSLGDASLSSATGFSQSSNGSQGLPSPPLGVGTGVTSVSNLDSLLTPKPDPAFTVAGPTSDLFNSMGPTPYTSSYSILANATSGTTTAAGSTQQIPGVAPAASFCNPTTGFSTVVPPSVLSVTVSNASPQVTSSGGPGASTSSCPSYTSGNRGGAYVNRLGVLADVALLYGGPEPSSSNSFSRSSIRGPSPPTVCVPKSSPGNPTQGLEGLAVEVIPGSVHGVTGATTSGPSASSHPGTVTLPTPLTPVELVRQILFQKLVIFRLGVLHTAMPAGASSLLSEAEALLQPRLCSSCPLTCIYCAFRGLHQLRPGSATQYLGLVVPEPQSPSWTVELELTTTDPSPTWMKFLVKPHRETTLLERLLAWRLYPQDNGSYVIHNPTVIMSPSGILHPVVLATPPPKMILRSRWYVIYLFVGGIFVYVCYIYEGVRDAPSIHSTSVPTC